jgi:amino acid permease
MNDAERNLLKQIANRADSIVNMVNLQIGAGVLALPYAFNNDWGGWWTLILIGVTTILSVISNHILVVSCHFYDADSYQSLIRKAGGVHMEVFAVLWMIGIQFGACVVYLVAIFDLAGKPGIVCLAIFPLCFVRSLKSLAPASLCGIVCAVIMTCIMIYKSIAVIMSSKGVFGECNLDSMSDTPNPVAPVGLIVFAFANHVSTPSLFAELKDPHSHEHREFLLQHENADVIEVGALLQYENVDVIEVGAGKSRRKAAMKNVVYVATLVVATLYVAIGVSGYLVFGICVDKSNVLNSFDEDDGLIVVAKICMCCLLSVSFPIVQLVAKSMIHSLTSPAEELGMEMSAFKHVGITIFFVASTSIMANFVEELAVAVSFIGATGGILSMFALPAYLIMVQNGPYASAQWSGPCKVDSVGIGLLLSALLLMILSVLDTFQIT